MLAAVAAIDEYHQSFVPSRTAAITDVLIDMSGGLVALTILALWRLARAAWTYQRYDRTALAVAAWRAEFHRPSASGEYSRFPKNCLQSPEPTITLVVLMG